MLFKKYLILGYFLGSNSRSNSGPIFDSTSSQIPIFWTIMMITSQFKPNYSCFWPFMGNSRIITQLWCHKYKLVLPDSSKNLTFILKNLANNVAVKWMERSPLCHNKDVSRHVVYFDHGTGALQTFPSQNNTFLVFLHCFVTNGKKKKKHMKKGKIQEKRESTSF